MKLEKIKFNPQNPRKISKENLTKLCTSIEEFPKMMELRPIVIDEDNISLGGNMRLLALNELGYSEIPDNWVKKITDLTEIEKKEFIIKDNISFGEMDYLILYSEFSDISIDILDSWGLSNIEENFKSFIDNNSLIVIDTDIFTPEIINANNETGISMNKRNESKSVVFIRIGQFTGFVNSDELYEAWNKKSKNRYIEDNNSTINKEFAKEIMTVLLRYL